MLPAALVLARLVVENNSPVPRVTEDAVLLVQRTNANLGCAPGDAGPGGDAGLDAGPADAGVDAGTDAGCEPVVGDAVSMVVRPRFSTDVTGTRFALLFVTPSRPVVETVADPFPELAALTAPVTEIRVVEVPDPALGERCGGGCGFASSDSVPGSFDPPDLGDGGLGDGGVAVETVGPYEIVRVQPTDTADLTAVLTGFNYRVQQDDVDALAPYIAAGYTVVAVRVAIDQSTALSPLSMTWAGTELRLPLALGTDDAGGLTAYIASNSRHELPGADISYARPTFGGETSFLTRNDLRNIGAMTPDEDPVAVAIPGNPEFSITNIVEQKKRVPVTNCGVDIGCCSAAGSPRADFGIVAGVVALLLRRRRRRR